MENKKSLPFLVDGNALHKPFIHKVTNPQLPSTDFDLQLMDGSQTGIFILYFKY